VFITFGAELGGMYSYILKTTDAGKIAAFLQIFWF